MESSQISSNGWTIDKPDKYITYKFRYYIAFSCIFVNIANAGVWVTLGAISNTAQKYYQVDSFGIEILSLIFFICYIVASPVSSWMLDVKGIRSSLIIGSLLNLMGALIKWMACYITDSNSRFSLTIFGQVIAGLSQPFLLNAPTKIASKWFSDSERTLANACMSLGNPLGIAAILAYSPAVVSGNHTKLPTLNMIVAIISFLAAISSIFTMNVPLTPPSASLAIDNTPFIEGVKSLGKQRNYVILWFVFGFFVGIFNVYVTLISDYILPFGYSEDDAGMLGAVTIISGIVSAIFAGWFLDRTSQHSLYLKCTGALASLGALLFLLGILKPNSIEYLYVGAAIIGIGGFPIECLSLELGVESTWPISEGTSAGFLWMSSQIWAIVFLFISNALRKDGNMKNALIFNVCVASITCIISLLYVNERKRKDATV